MTYSGASTFTDSEAALPIEVVAAIVVLPAETPVTTPLITVATFSSDELHDSVLSALEKAG